MKPLPGILCKSADTLWHNPIKSMRASRTPDAIRSAHQGSIGHNCHSCSSHTRTPGVSLLIWDSRVYSARYTTPFGHRLTVITPILESATAAQHPVQCHCAVPVHKMHKAGQFGTFNKIMHMNVHQAQSIDTTGYLLERFFEGI
jgi:hypothetical protein